jgi:hypothetical protein
VTVFIIILWVWLNVKIIHFGTSLGRYKGLENQKTSKQNKETYRCPFKIHLQQSNTEACKVFDESPTPEQGGFFQLLQLRIFQWYQSMILASRGRH